MSNQLSEEDILNYLKEIKKNVRSAYIVAWITFIMGICFSIPNFIFMTDNLVLSFCTMIWVIVVFRSWWHYKKLFNIKESFILTLKSIGFKEAG